MDMMKRSLLDKRGVPRVAQAAILSVLFAGVPLSTSLAEQMDGTTRSGTDDPAGQIGETLPATEHQAEVIEGEQTPGDTKPQAGQMGDTGVPATKHQAKVVEGEQTPGDTKPQAGQMEDASNPATDTRPEY